MPTGFIYILSNVSMPGLVKIGRTDRTLEQRMAQLNTTGVPTPFVLEHYSITSNSVMAEKEIHAILAVRGIRNTNNREFFKMEVKKAKQVVDAIASLYSQEEEKEEEIEAVDEEKAFYELQQRFYETVRSIPKISCKTETQNYINIFTEFSKLGIFEEYARFENSMYLNDDSPHRWRVISSCYANVLKEKLCKLHNSNSSGATEAGRVLGIFLANHMLKAQHKDWLGDDDIEFVSNFIKVCSFSNDESCRQEFFKTANAETLSKTIMYKIHKILNA